MSDVIISRRGKGKSSGGDGIKLVTEYITSNQNWVVPSGVKNNEFSVRIFGAGATIYSDTWGVGTSGGGGWMNNDTLLLDPGQVIPITIGISVNYKKFYDSIHDGVIANGGTAYSNREGFAGILEMINRDKSYIGNNIGESSSFGTYLSASGGSRANGGAGGAGGGEGYQFGGGGGTYNYNGGNGGPWGGGGGSRNNTGGTGGIYGGGGGTADDEYGGGNGGKYGGGGGGGLFVHSTNISKSRAGIGGEYGGNGGNWGISNVNLNYSGNNCVNAENGTNTIGNSEIQFEFRGEGLSGGDGCAGGGGYGGNGGKSDVSYTNQWFFSVYGGGGGGYGSNGGNASKYGAGGGGYGGDGEKAIRIQGWSGLSTYGAGGGGYGKTAKGFFGGGGGYYCPGGGINVTYGGGGYGIWSNNEFIASYATGGTCNNVYSKFGEPGICIIQYYV